MTTDKGDGLTSNPIFKRSLAWGGLLALAIAVVGGSIGFAVDGMIGLTSALIGTAMAVVFLGITAGSILFANRFFGSDLYVAIFFGVVMGGWIVKFVIFLVLAWLLRGQPWINPTVLFLSVIAGVVGSLVVDTIVVVRGRVPYTGTARPPAREPDGE